LRGESFGSHVEFGWMSLIVMAFLRIRREKCELKVFRIIERFGALMNIFEPLKISENIQIIKQQSKR
jgi:hypothetical protein